jgi:hypothetical protein
MWGEIKKKKKTFENIFQIEPAKVPLPHILGALASPRIDYYNRFFRPCACDDGRIFMKFRICDLYQ